MLCNEYVCKRFVYSKEPVMLRIAVAVVAPANQSHTLRGGAGAAAPPSSHSADCSCTFKSFNAYLAQWTTANISQPTAQKPAVRVERGAKE